jgi:HEAT repeat protein
MMTRTSQRRAVSRGWRWLLAAGAVLAIVSGGCAKRPKSVSALTAELSDANPDVRWAAAKGLEAYGPQARPAIPALAKALQDEDGRVRYRAAKALSKVGAGLEPAVPALAESLADQDRDVRYYAAKALDAADKDAVPVLSAMMAALEKEQDVKTRCYLVRSLKNLGAESGPAVPLLQKLSRDGKDEVRKAATDALASINRKLQRRSHPE